MMSGSTVLRRVVATNVRVHSRATVSIIRSRRAIVTHASVGAWSTRQPRRQAYSTTPAAGGRVATKLDATAPKATLEEASTALLDDDDDAKAAPATAKRLLVLAEPERNRLAAGLGLQSMSSGLSLFLPYAIGQIVDGCAGNWGAGEAATAVAAAAWTLTSAATALLGVFGVQAVVMTARQHVLNVAGENVAARARKSALANLVEQEIAFFDKRDSSELCNRLGADAANLQKALTTHLASAASSTFSAIGAIAMLFSISPQLALLSLAVFPPVFLFASWRGRRMRKAQKKVQESLALANGVAQRTLGNLRTLRVDSASDVLHSSR